MGYFSNLTIDHGPYDHDCSYTPAQLQLLWRLEELEDRLDLLLAQRKDERICFTEEQLRYVLPKHFMSVADVQRAIELAVEELSKRYHIRVREEAEEPVVDELTDMQLSFRELLATCAA